jgi:hypothetical protein
MHANAARILPNRVIAELNDYLFIREVAVAKGPTNCHRGTLHYYYCSMGPTIQLFSLADCGK